MDYNYFSGSYDAADVRFLLKPIAVDNTPISIKENLIQSGEKHYSEMLTHEQLPNSDYIALFEQAMADNKTLMAEHSLVLAYKILSRRPNGITLVSLARAGTPVGVILKKIFQTHFGLEFKHYSISIIRDIGIDNNALLHILSQHSAESLVFIDGWTGKGVISKQLETSLKQFAERYAIKIPAELYVLADLCGSAFEAASNDDYLIPSSILNATVSGLVSRSIIDKSQLSETDFHGCYYYANYAESDFSKPFVNSIMASINTKNLPTILKQSETSKSDQILCKQQLKSQSEKFIEWVKQSFQIRNLNMIKPGIGEATRVLLRREADLLLLRDRNDRSTQHLIYLAEVKNIKLQIVPNLAYRAVALIKERL